MSHKKEFTELENAKFREILSPIVPPLPHLKVFRRKTPRSVSSRTIVKVGAFCRKALSPQGERRVQYEVQCHVQCGEDFRLQRNITCAHVAAGREVLPGRQDRLKSPLHSGEGSIKYVFNRKGMSFLRGSVSGVRGRFGICRHSCRNQNRGCE